ncbi:MULTISPECIES: YidC/Oxa1 family membrane protein insertase [Paenibacillus]|uniref:YidC/Oxa1 family membrane protein insertase n=1 Tax=Paenibacillus TaxID=44249 RepID=UPI0022B888DA|nr:YidC/Oxa1 family membrane protein insertase [Paenibacillus caseinilyticus]MCZ8524013.1 YidC/Oxa1 family membrane protein insertase [Paenibacillus caseinilyticus]
MYTFVQPLTDVLAHVMSLIYGWTQDWGAALILLTFGVRLLLIRFNLNAARQQVRTAAAQPELAKLREKHGKDLPQLVRHTADVNRAYGIRPFAPFAAALVQAPLLMAMYGLFLTHGSTMTTFLLPWMASLGVADPLHLLPLAAGLLSAAAGLLPMAEAPVLGSMAPGMGSRVFLGLLLLLVPLAVTWAAPAAVGLYWAAGSAFGLLERLFYRTPPGRRLVRRGLPEAAVGGASG